MKKIISLALALIFVLIMVSSCGEGIFDNTTDEKPNANVISLDFLMNEMENRVPSSMIKYMERQKVNSKQFKDAFVGTLMPGNAELMDFDIVEGIIYQAQIIPNDLIFGIIKVDENFNVEGFVRKPDEFVNRVVQVCTIYPQAIAINYNDIIFVAMGTPNALETLSTSFNQIIDSLNKGVY